MNNTGFENKLLKRKRKLRYRKNNKRLLKLPPNGQQFLYGNSQHEVWPRARDEYNKILLLLLRSGFKWPTNRTNYPKKIYKITKNTIFNTIMHKK